MKLQYFGHLMQRADSLEKTLMLGKIEGRRRRGRQRMRWLDGITDSIDMSLSRLWGVGDGQGSLACCSPWGLRESDMTEQLTELIVILSEIVYQHEWSLEWGFHLVKLVIFEIYVLAKIFWRHFPSLQGTREY